MYRSNKKINNLNKKIEKLNLTLEELEIMGKKGEIIKRNLLAGVFRGIGIGIGVTLVSSVIVWTLQKIVTLNLPVISRYISDIIEIVKKNSAI